MCTLKKPDFTLIYMDQIAQSMWDNWALAVQVALIVVVIAIELASVCWMVFTECWKYWYSDLSC